MNYNVTLRNWHFKIFLNRLFSLFHCLRIALLIFKQNPLEIIYCICMIVCFNDNWLIYRIFAYLLELHMHFAQCSFVSGLSLHALSHTLLALFVQTSSTAHWSLVYSQTHTDTYTYPYLHLSIYRSIYRMHDWSVCLLCGFVVWLMSLSLSLDAPLSLGLKCLVALFLCLFAMFFVFPFLL